MISSTLNEISTNESPAQSPKKISLLINPNIQLPYFNLNLQKISEEKKIFPQNEIFLGKLRKIETIKAGENKLLNKRIQKDIIKKPIEKKNVLLDFDFLVGEILNKIYSKSRIISSNVKKKKKSKMKHKKIIKKIKCETSNCKEIPKSK